VRDFALVAGGGAGPVHAAFIADLLHMPQVVIPPIAATYSAFGMFAMDVGRNYARSYITRAKSVDLERVNALYAEMEREALERFTAIGTAADAVRFTRTADVRYVGQFHEVEVEVPAASVTAEALATAIENFHQRHQDLYTFAMRWQAVELLTFRLRATTGKAPFELRRIDAGSGDASAARKRTRTCRFDGADMVTPVYNGALLGAGDRFDGPALIEETTTTVVIPPSYDCTVDSFRNYVLTRRQAGEPGQQATAAGAAGGAR
jgi:N-methylhydantoinase A